MALMTDDDKLKQLDTVLDQTREVEENALRLYLKEPTSLHMENLKECTSERIMTERGRRFLIKDMAAKATN